jgi:hypothetical protein
VMGFEWTKNKVNVRQNIIDISLRALNDKLNEAVKSSGRFAWGKVDERVDWFTFRDIKEKKLSFVSHEAAPSVKLPPPDESIVNVEEKLWLRFALMVNVVGGNALRRLWVRVCDSCKWTFESKGGFPSTLLGAPRDHLTQFREYKAKYFHTEAWEDCELYGTCFYSYEDFMGNIRGGDNYVHSGGDALNFFSPAGSQNKGRGFLQMGYYPTEHAPTLIELYQGHSY